MPQGELGLPCRLCVMRSFAPYIKRQLPVRLMRDELSFDRTKGSTMSFDFFPSVPSNDTVARKLHNGSGSILIALSEGSLLG